MKGCKNYATKQLSVKHYAAGGMVRGFDPKRERGPRPNVDDLRTWHEEFESRDRQGPLNLKPDVMMEKGKREIDYPPTHKYDYVPYGTKNRATRDDAEAAQEAIRKHRRKYNPERGPNPRKSEDI